MHLCSELPFWYLLPSLEVSTRILRSHTNKVKNKLPRKSRAIGQKGLRTKFCTKWKESESHNECYLYRRSEETCYTNLQEI